MAKKIDRIAQMLNCPEKGEELRRAITESRKDFLMSQPDAAEDEELEEEFFEGDEDEEFEWWTD